MASHHKRGTVFACTAYCVVANVFRLCSTTEHIVLGIRAQPTEFVFHKNKQVALKHRTMILLLTFHNEPWRMDSNHLAQHGQMVLLKTKSVCMHTKRKNSSDLTEGKYLTREKHKSFEPNLVDKFEFIGQWKIKFDK